MEFWQQLVRQHPKAVLYGLMVVAVILLYWPLKRLGAALRKVKWLNKEIAWPGSRRAENPARDRDNAAVTPPPKGPPFGTAIDINLHYQADTPPPENPSGPRDPGEVVQGLVGNYLKKQLFHLLLLLLLAPGFLCGFWLFEPPGFAAGFPAAFQSLCVIGLLVSIVVAAVLYLHFEDKLGLK